MRATATVACTVVACMALVLPSAETWAAAKPPKKKPTITVKDAWFLGSQVHVGPFGDVLVRIDVRKWTIVNGKHVTVKRHIMKIRIPVWTNHTARSVMLTQRALPTLASETIREQSAKIEYVAGATLTSNAFMESLQAAILKSDRW
jgi:uncharacterized protein with FMN-binding domain